MRLFYLDENKHSDAAPDFLIGGILIPGDAARTLDGQLRQIQKSALGTALLDKARELHGKDVFHGKGNFKGRPLAERMDVLRNVDEFIVDNGVVVRRVRIDVPEHRRRYRFPEPAYRLGLMLALERACDVLDAERDDGLVFADYEQDEITRSVLDFSLHQARGKTPMSHGRSLERLVDTIYFTQSHHSRFLQVADIVVFLAQRYGRLGQPKAAWHEQQAFAAWQAIAGMPTTRVQDWPP